MRGAKDERDSEEEARRETAGCMFALCSEFMVYVWRTQANSRLTRYSVAIKLVSKGRKAAVVR